MDKLGSHAFNLPVETGGLLHNDVGVVGVQEEEEGEGDLTVVGAGEDVGVSILQPTVDAVGVWNLL